MLDWHENNLPVSTRFDDPYYSKQDGRAETDHVFIKANKLPERWPFLQRCVIAELGFGTGLNFLETVRQWQHLKPDLAKLHFISFEQYPLSRSDMEKALSVWPELDPLTMQLLEHWSTDEHMMSAEVFDGVFLTVHFGDANVLLPRQIMLADAWYLDGFSPAKNPELWNETLLSEVFQHTAVNGTFATYTAAGFVRRNLEKAGFEVNKVRGFAHKRDMLSGSKV